MTVDTLTSLQPPPIRLSQYLMDQNGQFMLGNDGQPIVSPAWSRWYAGLATNNNAVTTAIPDLISRTDVLSTDLNTIKAELGPKPQGIFDTVANRFSVFDVGPRTGFIAPFVNPRYLPYPNWPGFNYEAAAYVDIPVPSPGVYWYTGLHIKQTHEGSVGIYFEDSDMTGDGISCISAALYGSGEAMYWGQFAENARTGMEIASWGSNTSGIIITYQNRLMPLNAPLHIEDSYDSGSLVILRPWNCPTNAGEINIAAPGNFINCLCLGGREGEQEWQAVMMTQMGQQFPIVNVSGSNPITITLSSPDWETVQSVTTGLGPYGMTAIVTLDHSLGILDGWRVRVVGLGSVPDGTYPSNYVNGNPAVLALYQYDPQYQQDGFNRHDILPVTVSGSYTPGGTVTAECPLLTDFLVSIAGVTGCTAANGSWYITRIDEFSFSIPAVSNGAYAGGGTVTLNDMPGISIRDVQYQPRFRANCSGDVFLDTELVTFRTEHRDSRSFYIGGGVFNGLYHIPAYWKQYVEVSSLFLLNNDFLGNEYAPDMKWHLQMPTGGGYFGGWADVLTFDQFRLATVFGDFKLATAQKGVIMTNAAGTVTRRVRLNDAGNGLIYEVP